MGEWSKKIGEYGENVVENFLSVVGWQDLAKGETIKCSKQKGEHTDQQGKTKHTHGIDFLYSYKSPLVDSQLNNIIISSKFETQKYPKSATKKFKWFITDLINTMDCFDYSDLKDQLLQEYSYNSINDVGVLFWLNNQENSNDDIISVVSSTRFDICQNNSIYIMDNKRVGFILEIMKFIKAKNEYNYSFYYPVTGQNLNPLTRNNSGSILPVEYLNSSIIPIRLEKNNNQQEVSLFLGIIDGFEKDTFMRLMGLAKDISTNLVGQVIIGFPDYNELNHKDIVSIAKQGFQDVAFTKTVNVVNFINPSSIF